MKKTMIIIIGLLLIILISSCRPKNDGIAGGDKEMNTEDNKDIFADKEVIVSVSEVKKIVADNKDLLILDTRTQEEYDSGHIEGALLIPYNELESRLDEIDEYEDKPILVYCRTGRRSSIAVQTLIDNGFNKIYHMNQGYSKWK